MEDAAFNARIQRLDRDITFFQQSLQQARRAETAEIRRQLMATLQEKKALLQRQKEQVSNHIAQKDLENERMARAIEAIERMRNAQN
jgi:primosomal protein N''